MSNPPRDEYQPLDISLFTANLTKFIRDHRHSRHAAKSNVQFKPYLGGCALVSGTGST
jgi:hypothetical protein